MADPKEIVTRLIQEARQAEEERSRSAATNAAKARQEVKAATLAFQTTVMPALQEACDWLRTQAITAKLFEEHLPPRFRMARLLVWPPRINVPDAAAPYVAFRFDLEEGEVSCSMQLRDDYLGDPRYPAGARWKPKELSREAAREATYLFLQQLFTIYK